MCITNVVSSQLEPFTSYFLIYLVVSLSNDFVVVVINGFRTPKTNIYRYRYIITIDFLGLLDQNQWTLYHFYHFIRIISVILKFEIIFFYFLNIIL